MNFFIVMTVVIGTVYCGMALLAPFAGHFRKVRPRAAVFAGSALLFFGGLGWFGSALSAWGGLNWLSPYFEWPVGTSDRVITLPGGEHVAPLIFSGRVQIYDRNLKFLRGWAVPSYGKPFKVRPAGSGRFDALYGTRADTYLLDGTLVRHAVEQREERTLPSYGQRMCIPTSPWLLMYTGPVTTWLVSTLGLAVLGFLQWRERRASMSSGPYTDV
jgi:hypothetical protein